VLPEAPTDAGTAGIEATVFEPPPPMLLPSAATPPGKEWQATALGLLAGAALSAAILAGADRIIARRQEAIVTSLRDQRRIAEEMALQDLRADLDDVVSLGTRRFRATMFLENQRRDRPLFVLGPSIAAAMQRDGSWNTFALDGNGTTGATVRPIEAAKTTIAVEFTLPEGSYDELIRGYLHVRFTASMVVSERDDGTGDLFERIDGYYVYLRDPALSEDDVRRLNEWPPGSTVPAWIAMPAH
jgi:putative ABC transport system ATP-binding protein/macrolide transport system ATP-binding/permease protein/lipoprotein-releasing system ATP-binding protein